NDVSDAHVDVVHNHAHLIRGEAPFFVISSRAQQYKVFDLVVGEFPLAEDAVVELGRSAEGNLESDSRFDARGPGLSVAAGTGADATCFFAFSLHSVIAACVLFGSTVTEKGASVGEQLLRGLPVQLGALRLVNGAFVPIDAEPLKTVQNSADEFG